MGCKNAENVDNTEYQAEIYKKDSLQYLANEGISIDFVSLVKI